MKNAFLGVDVSKPEYLPITAWLGHAPFGSWVVQAARPSRLVELGTHAGYSYFNFCQTVHAKNLQTECFAVDTWAGDEHAGFYDESVFQQVYARNREYRRFSTLLRKTFAEALDEFEDGSIDLLHIDGRHYYEDVKEDFETWSPKLSPSSIVLFHDTEVRERDFGVWRLWQEISPTKPSISFLHDHGLGVLFWGHQFSSKIEELIELAKNPEGQHGIRRFFEGKGAEIATACAKRRKRQAVLAFLSKPFRP